MTRSSHPLRTPARRIIRLALPLSLLLCTGCESLLFRFVNRSLPPPEATVAYAPELGLSLDIYRPRPTLTRAASDGGAPVVVFFYGGAWQRGERAQYRFVGQRLAQHGILAIVADYRTWPRAGFPEFMDDAARAVAWADGHAARWGGDPQRLFLAGHSAGAHIAALLATDGRYLGRRGIASSGLAGVIGMSGPYDFEITGKLRPIFGDPGRWPRAQPVNFVDGDEPPFLLIHGLRDSTVESADSVQLARSLRAHGVDTRLVLLPEGTHSTPLAGLYDPRRAPSALPAILAFVRQDASVPPPSQSHGPSLHRTQAHDHDADRHPLVSQ